MGPMTRLTLLGLALSGLLWASQVKAIEFFCNPVDLCAWVPTDDQGQAVYNHSDPDRPWVIGGNEVVSLDEGAYGVGVGAVGQAMIFVIEQGTLAIEDLGDAEVGLGAWIVLCDQATFRLRDATLRLLSDFPFQHPLFALGQSRVEMEDARVRAIRPELEAAGYHGAFFQVMGEQSTLVVTPGALLGMTMPHQGDAWELAVVHQAQAVVDSAYTFGEFYIQGTADFTVRNSRYHDLFFEACPGDAFTLADLPELCDLFDPVDGCITAGHQPIDFQLGPPATPFSLTLQNDLVFSWAVSTYAGSSARVERARPLSNFAVGLGGIHDDLDLRLGPGSPPIMEGLTDRNLEFIDSHVIGWMVWPVGSSHIRLLPGSEVGDLLPGDQSVCVAEETLLTGAMFDSPPGTEVHLFDSVLDERATNSGGKLFATRTAIDVPMAIAGPTWLADPAGVDQFDLRPGGVVHRVALTAPGADQVIGRVGVEVRGTVAAVDGAGTVIPFPPALLALHDADGALVAELAQIDQPVTDAALAFWDPEQLPGGSYSLRLAFADPDGQQAVSVRALTLDDLPADDGGVDGETDGQADADVVDGGGDDPDGGADGALDAGDAAADAGDHPGGGGGCGCGSAGAGDPLVLLALMALVWLRGRTSRWVPRRNAS